MRTLFQPWSAEREYQHWPFRASATLTLPGRAPARYDLFTSLTLVTSSIDVHISSFFRWRALAGYPYGVKVSTADGEHILTGLVVTDTFTDEVTMQFVLPAEAEAVMQAGTFAGIPHMGTPCGVAQISPDGFSSLSLPEDGEVSAGSSAFPLDPSCLFVPPLAPDLEFAGRRLSGSPWIIAGDGVVFQHVTSGPEPVNEVRVHRQGASKAEKQRLACEQAGLPVPEGDAPLYPLRSINGLSPDAYGRLGVRLLTPGEGGTIGTALRLRRTSGGLQFSLAGKKQ